MSRIKLEEVKEYIEKMRKGSFIYIGSIGVLNILNTEEDAYKLFKENQETLGLQEVARYRCVKHCTSFTQEEYDELEGELFCDECFGESFVKETLFMVK